MPSTAPQSQAGLVAAILCGGRSTRMGQPKEAVPLWDGRPMLAHGIETLHVMDLPIVILGTPQNLSLPTDSKITVLPDKNPGLGPLSGLETLLASGMADHFLVVSCDQPLLSPPLLQCLIRDASSGLRFFRTISGDACDPFPGIFPASILPALQKAMATQQYSIRALIAQFPVTWVPLPPQFDGDLLSVNTPADLSAVLQRRLESSLSPVLHNPVIPLQGAPYLTAPE